MIKPDGPTGQSESSEWTSMIKLAFITAAVGAFGSFIIGLINWNKHRLSAVRVEYSSEIAAEHVQPPSIDKGLSDLSQSPQQKYLEGQVSVSQLSSEPIVRSTVVNRTMASHPADTVTPPVFTLTNKNNQPTKTIHWSLPTKYIVGIGLALGLLFVAWIIRPAFVMLIIAVLLAFIVQPVISFFYRRLKWKRATSVTIAYGLVIALLIIMPLILIPALVNSINDLLMTDWEKIGYDFAIALETTASNVSTIPIVGPPLASSLDTLAQILSGVSTLAMPEPIKVDVSANTLDGHIDQTSGRLAVDFGTMVSAVISLVFIILISLRHNLAMDDMRVAYPRLIPPAKKTRLSASLKNGLF